MAIDDDPTPVVGLDYFDPRAAANPRPVFERMRNECPVGAVIPSGVTCVSRYEDVQWALQHPEIFSSAMPAGLIGNVRPLIPLNIDPPEQTKYRKLLDPLFSRRRMQQLEPDLRILAGRLIDAFADHGRCEFNHEFAVPYPCTVFLRLMGLPQEDAPLLLELKDGIIRPPARDLAEAGAMRARTGQRIYAYFEQILDERARHPKDDLLSEFLCAEIRGERLTREEILDICYLFLLGGLDTVTATLGCAVSYLARHPERRQRLVDDPSLLPGAVEELLRWETPVMQVIRILKEDVTLAGVELEAGQAVSLVLASADTDPAHFEAADVVDFERRSNRHLAFGGGAHRCLGSHLARIELCIALEELHVRIPSYEIEPGDEPRYSPAIREVTHLPLRFPAVGAA